MNTEATHYELLGVPRDAAKDEIRAVYQEKLGDLRAARTREEEGRRPSEDVIRASREEEARLRAAWQVLSDPVQRQRYDERLAPAEAGDVEDDDEEGPDEPDVTPTRTSRDPPGSVVTAQGLEIPTPGRRATAAAIDTITMLALWAAIVYPLTLAAGLKSGVPALITVVGTMEVLVFGYLVLPTWRTGQTLGKRYTYCMVVDRATGQLPTLGQTIRRYLIPAFAFAILETTGGFIALIFGISFLMNKDQVSLADRFAKTAVVIARYRPERSG